MYQVEASKALLKPRLWLRRPESLRVSRNVVMLGMTSMLTDVSSEMVATILPIYLVFSLGASPLALGAIDGTYRGAAAVVQVAAGFMSDRFRRHKQVAETGYAFSAIGKVALVAAGNSIGGIGAIVAFDRIGKGIRTAPRDALISLSSTRDNLATSFGVHRALDSVGAFLGPLVAFGILLVAPARFDAVFFVSTLFAFLGLAVLVLTVQGKPWRAPREETTPPSMKRAAGLLRESKFVLLLVAALILSLTSVSDAMIYVGLQRKIDFDPAVFPLLYVVTAVAFMVLAIPIGRLADRIGRVPVLIGGFAMLFIDYGALMSDHLGYAGLIFCLIALGAFFACSEGVLTAVAGAALPDDLQASGIGMLITVVSIGNLVSSIAFGALWVTIGLQSAVIVFAAALALALLTAAPLLVRSQRTARCMGSRNAKILIALVVLCVVGGGVYVAVAATGPNGTETDQQPVATDVLDQADLLVRAVDPKKPTLNGGVFEVDDGKVHRGGDLSCERVYYAAGGGICMGVAPSGVDYTATVFNEAMEGEHTIPLQGLPSRARVSKDGKYGSMTVFVTGDSYLESSTAFSTRTYVVDMATGKVADQLEQFTVTKDGKPFEAVDFNFWGMTFDPTDSDRFYATLGTGDHHYLVEGSISDEEMKVLRDGVECPSLSPDGKQIAYKSRLGHSNRWHLRVLDVATLKDHAVAETRSVDDQAEWLSDTTLAYSDGTNVYTVPADGSGEEQLLVRDASSPVRLEEPLIAR